MTPPEKQAGITAPLAKRTENGQFARGTSGNYAGRPKGVSPIVALAREHSPAAIQTLAEIACKGKNENARIAAANSLLDRAYGRPAQSVELDLKLSQSLQSMSLEELQQFREKYAQLALASPKIIEHDGGEQPATEHDDGEA